MTPSHHERTSIDLLGMTEDHQVEPFSEFPNLFEVRYFGFTRYLWSDPVLRPAGGFAWKKAIILEIAEESPFK